jgi:hypothetical protein
MAASIRPPPSSISVRKRKVRPIFRKGERKIQFPRADDDDAALPQEGEVLV